MRRTPQEWLDIALDDPRPDQRRKAINEIAEGDAAAAGWAQRAFDVIARTDPDSMVRVAAVRGLARGAAPSTPSTLVKLLQSDDRTFEDVRPAPGPVRWEAALLLDRLLDDGRVAESDRERVLAALLQHAGRETDRNVRLAAVRGLRHFQDGRAIPVLLAALDERDFALRDGAEQSLHDLTGHCCEHDSRAWRAWLDAADDPFADAGTWTESKEHLPWWKRWLAWANGPES